MDPDARVAEGTAASAALLQIAAVLAPVYFRTPRRDPTEWQVIGSFTPADVREAAAPLREALANTARDEFQPGAGRLANV
jgi:hypothetical protein